jgi:hypothetical protein
MGRSLILDLASQSNDAIPASQSNVKATHHPGKPTGTGQNTVRWKNKVAQYKKLFAVTCAGILSCFPPLSLLAQNGDSFISSAESIVDFRATPHRAIKQCDELISYTSHDFSILTTELVRGQNDIPIHCRLTGAIPPEIFFETNLPLEWNGRFYMMGNGGFAGRPPSSRTDERHQALRNGFATAYTNTGHDADREPLASFAYNNLQKTIDYTFRAVHLTVVSSKELMGEFYQRQPDYSYWDGCSQGGRQGLVNAQRFPDDFDGIVAGAPAFDFTGTMLMYAWHSQVMDGGSFSPDKVNHIAEQVYARCDEIDGLKDGLITDPRQCDFDPRKHLESCEDTDTSEMCFNQDEMTRLGKLYDGPQRDGKPLYPGAPKGAEARGLMVPYGTSEQIWASGWIPWIISPAGTTLQLTMVESFLKFLAFEHDDPDYDWREYPIETEAEGLDRATAGLLDAKNTDLTRFKNGGSKMITYFGWADTAIHPMPIIDYYEGVENTMGEAPHDFYRLFMVPGMFHCSGGLGADQMDVMTPIIEWVEAGKAPDFIIGSQLEKDTVNFTRPQCPYPQVAVYLGSGDVKSAESFECGLQP